ncbi:papilin [Rhipicephalus sanguineus]|uniref:papilin n=1 Tax=Rhipicephalus sanguineus TaxID=34632 RepID=UPI0020C56F1F|nr:papilin [Rhipicephalus sanguineus]
MELLYCILLAISLMRVHGTKLFYENNRIKGTRHAIPALCTQSHITASCGASAEVWYFDGVAGTCRIFPPGQCMDGGNTFATHHECKQTCQSHKKPYPICSRTIELGECSRNFYNKWYFSSNSGRCLQFSSKLCLKGGNAFQTYPLCMRRCSRRFYQAPETCTKSPSLSSCRPRMEAWYYDITARRCRTLPPGVCVEGDNYFATLQKCKEKHYGMLQCRRNMTLTSSVENRVARTQAHTADTAARFRKFDYQATGQNGDDPDG